jgi:hypothetical protein
VSRRGALLLLLVLLALLLWVPVVEEVRNESRVGHGRGVAQHKVARHARHNAVHERQHGDARARHEQSAGEHLIPFSATSFYLLLLLLLLLLAIMYRLVLLQAASPCGGLVDQPLHRAEDLLLRRSPPIPANDASAPVIVSWYIEPFLLFVNKIPTNYCKVANTRTPPTVLKSKTKKSSSSSSSSSAYAWAVCEAGSRRHASRSLLPATSPVADDPNISTRAAGQRSCVLSRDCSRRCVHG